MKIPLEYSVLLPIRRGAKNRDVRLVQEWLALDDVGLRIDGEFGPATEAAVRRFQTRVKLHPTGIVDEFTLRALIAPISRVCKPLASTAETFSQRVVASARNHLREHPREIGGQNKGPWVRLYTGGKEGADWPWCAAFVSYMLKSAAEGQRPSRSPIKGSVSCDELANQAREIGKFVSEQDLLTGEVDKLQLVPGTIFLVRNKKSSTDWIHTGVVTSVHAEFMETIEGNTNDEGSREGHEVCKRLRGYANMDFIVW